MKLRRHWLVALLAVLALIVSACASDEGEGGGDDGGSDTTTGAADPDLAGTEVTVFSSEDGADEAGGIQAALDVFAERNNMTITHTGARDFSDQINAQAAGGNPPDIAMFPQPGKVIDFANQDFILPVPDEVLDVVRPQWPGGTLETYSTGGEVYALQVKTDLKSIVWYNTAVFNDNGYEIPTTLDELFTLTETMNADGITPCVSVSSPDPPLVGFSRTGWRTCFCASKVLSSTISGFPTKSHSMIQQSWLWVSRSLICGTPTATSTPLVAPFQRQHTPLTTASRCSMERAPWFAKRPSLPHSCLRARP